MNHWLVLGGVLVVALTHLLMLMFPGLAKRMNPKVHAYSNLAASVLIVAGAWSELLASFGWTRGGGGYDFGGGGEE